MKSIYETCWIFLLAILIPVSASGQYKSDFADTVILNSSDLPYAVPKSDLLILINGNLTTSGTAIDVGDRNDIKIDGGGDTILFGAGDYDNSYGVKLSYSPERIQIKNITLIHGVADESQAKGCAPIHIMGDDSVWVENVNMVARGVEGNCLDATLLGGNGISNLWVKDCGCENLSHSYVNRSGDPAAAFRICADGSTLAADQYTGLLENVTVTTTPHSAIFGTGGSTRRPKMIIHDCNLTVDAHNDMYDTTNATSFHSSGDPYAISMYRLGPGSKIYNNIIRSGIEHEGGQGMIIQGARGTASDPIDIHNNDVQIHCGPNQYNLRNGGDGKTVGLYLRWPEGNSNMSNCYVKFHDNLVKVYGDALKDFETIGTLHTGSSAEGIRIHADSGFHNVEVFNNRVFALRSDSLSDTGTVATVAAMYARVDTNRTDTYALKNKLDVYGNVFKNNYYYAPKSPLYLGSIALHTLGGGNLLLYNDTINVGTSEGANETIVFPQYGTFRYSSTGSRLMDCVFMGYAEDDGIVWGNINTDDNGLGKDLRLDRLMTIKIKNESGGNVSGASVWVINNYGQTAASGTTDGLGEFTDTITYKAFHYNSPASTNTWYDSLSYNNFTVKAKVGNDSVLTSITVDDATVFPFIVTLSGAGGPLNDPPSIPTLASPSNGGNVSTLTPILTANNSSDTDGDDLTYSFQVSSNPTFTAIVAQETMIAEGVGSTTSWTVNTNLADDSTYYWRARAYDGQDYSGYSSFRAFAVDLPNNPPSIPILASPSNGQQVNDLTPTLTINNSSDADDDILVYNFQVSSNSSFTAIVDESGAVPQGTGSVTSWTIETTLNSYTNYWWRVKAYDGTDSSAFSQSSVFYVNYTEPNDPPSQPEPNLPLPGDTCETSSPLLIVNNSTDPNGDSLEYFFEVWDEQQSNIIKTSPSIPQGDSGTTSWEVDTSLQEDAAYSWRSRAFDGNDYAEWTGWSDFYIAAANHPPSVPIDMLPSDGDTLLGSAHSLIVYNSTDEDGDELTYQFLLCNFPDTTQIVENTSGVDEGGSSTTTYITSAQLTDGAFYCWKVRAYDGQEYSGWTADRTFMHLSFTVGIDDIPVPISPKEGDVISSGRPHFIIEMAGSDTDPDFYFEVADNPDFNNALVSGPVAGQVDETVWIPENRLNSDAEYFWRAKSTNSAWTEAISFFVNGKVHLSPNPYKPGKHGDGVVFRNVPDDATITITTVNGELVDRIHVGQGSEVAWDVTNDMGVQLSNGVYLYYILSHETAISGKFAVIR